MIMIADSGSTKTDWCLSGTNIRDPKFFFRTQGFNPFFVEKNFIINDLQKELPCNLDTRTVNELFIYGAGFIPNKKDVIEDAMRSIFARAKIYVETDLLAPPLARSVIRALLEQQELFMSVG